MLQIGDGLACDRFRIMLLAHQECKQVIIANVLVRHFAQIAQVIVMQFVLEELDYLRLRLAFGNVDIRFGHCLIPILPKYIFSITWQRSFNKRRRQNCPNFTKNALFGLKSSENIKFSTAYLQKCRKFIILEICPNTTEKKLAIPKASWFAKT